MTVGLVLSFSAAGFAAQSNPRLKNRTPEMMKKMKIEILNFDFMIPPKIKLDSKPMRLLRLCLAMTWMIIVIPNEVRNLVFKKL